MLRKFRHRATGAGLAVLFAAGPLLVSAPAGAESVESGQRVVFSGSGLLGLSCVAQPDARQITVPADSTLQVVNHTGYRARLLLDGDTKGEIADGDSAQVLFRRGPVTLSLLPSCVLSDESPTVRVDVEPAATPQPSPASPSAAPGGFVEPDATPATPLSTPTSGTPVTGGLPDAAGGRPRRPAAAGLPDLAATTSATRSRPATTGPGRINPGMPPGDAPTLVPGAAAGALPVTGGTVLPDVVGIASAAAEPVAALEPVTETGPVGLLAIIATICVAGVTAAAIRAIAAQRASRASMA